MSNIELSSCAPWLYGATLCLVGVHILVSRTKFSLTNFFYFLFFLFFGPAFFLYHNDLEDWGTYYRLSYVLTLSLGCLFIGWFVAHRAAKIFGLLGDPDWSLKRPAITPISKAPLLLLATFTAFVLAYFLFAAGGIEHLREGWTLDRESISRGAYDALRKQDPLLLRPGVSAKAFTYITGGVAPLIALLLIHVYHCSAKAKVLLFCGSIAYTGLVFLAKLSTLHKAPAVFFLLQVLVYWLLLKGTRIGIQHLLLFAAVSLLCLLPLYLKYTATDSIVDILNGMLIRLTAVPNECLTEFFGSYPSVYPHTWGMNIRLVHWLFGQGEFVPANELLDPTGGTINTMFLADAWVDFSWAGVVVFSLACGALLSVMDVIVLSNKSTANLALFVAWMGSVFALANTSLATCFISFGLLIYPALVWLLTSRAAPVVTTAPRKRAEDLPRTAKALTPAGIHSA